MAGYARSLLNFRGPLIREFLAAGCEVYCTAPENSDEVARQLTEWGAHYESLDLRRNRLGLLSDVRYAIGIWRLCRRLRPSCIFAYTVKPVVFGGAAAALAGVPRIFALITGLGYVFTGDTPRHRLLRSIVSRLYRLTLNRIDKVFFQNPDDRDYFVERGIVESSKTVIVNGSGVDLAFYCAVKIPRDGDIIFLMIARLIGDKGIREFVEASRQVRRKYPNARFWLLGPPDPSPDGISQEQVRAWTVSHDIEYWGYIQDVRPYLHQASVFVLPSYREGTPRTVLEAMAVGRPIITTDAPGCRQTVVPGVNGYQVPVRNARALARAMCEFLDNPASIVAMGNASRRLVEEKYDVRQVNARILQAMNLINGRSIA